MAILFSQVNIADAADVNPSGTNTSTSNIKLLIV